MPHAALFDRNAYQRAWAKRHPEKRKAIKKKWYDAHSIELQQKRREFRATNREQLKAWKKNWELANPEKVAAARAVRRVRRKRQELAASLRHRYQFSVADYEALLAQQGGKCAICSTVRGSDQGHRLYLDHDHKTGRVRGLLCKRCNSALGYMADDSDRLRRAAQYLEAR